MSLVKMIEVWRGPLVESMHLGVAAVAIAAGQMGGTDAYWKVHDWMMKNQKTLNDESLRAAAPDLGLDADKLIEMIYSDDIKQEVANHVNLTLPVIRQGVPTIYVNGKWVARWKFDEEIVLDDIFYEAAKSQTSR